MVNLSFSMLELEYFLLVFMRVATFIFVAPFFSTRGVPNTVKIGLSVFVAYIMYSFTRAHLSGIQYNTGVLYDCVEGSVGGTADRIGGSDVYFHCFICRKNHRYGSGIVHGKRI